MRRAEERSARASVVAAVPQKQPDRFLDGHRNLGCQRLTRHFGGALIGLEERHAVRALIEVAMKPRTLVVGQLSIEIVKTERDELFATDHDSRPWPGSV